MVRLLVFLWIFLLSVQFIDGMWLNLFVSLPPNVGPMRMMYMMDYGPVFMIHIVTTFILLLVAIVLVVLSFSNQTTLVLSTIALLSIILSGIGGILFIFSGFSNNLYSFIMSLGFLFAMVSYFLVIMISSRKSGSL
ncbi:hypothetical protein [Sulfuracidifex metallicus]|uniref:hypothetical protein n=1 Tax=Sulfuracidifex metallicus TaxID=47303 RepID=UPI00227669D3|nr:hypothetical protein [Sulfuracidifex metallicus]MCY0849683.1 hypothetical protein [Sulfuracidifex metallicus]